MSPTRRRRTGDGTFEAAAESTGTAFTDLAEAPTGVPDEPAWMRDGSGAVEEDPAVRAKPDPAERTYSPDPSLTHITKRLLVYQSFNAPVNVTGGTEEREVMVNGQPATLYRSPPDGELVLVWRLADDGVALVAYEQEFALGDLIELAESASLAAH